MKRIQLAGRAGDHRVASPAPILDADYEPQAAHVPLAHYLWILRRHGWKIARTSWPARVLATLIVSLRLTPDLRIDRDHRHRPPACPPACWARRPCRTSTNDADQFLATQVKLIQSDSVLRPVVDKFHLREVEKDALEEAVDTIRDQSGSAGDPEESESHAAAEHLSCC